MFWTGEEGLLLVVATAATGVVGTVRRRFGELIISSGADGLVAVVMDARRKQRKALGRMPERREALGRLTSAFINDVFVQYTAILDWFCGSDGAPDVDVGGPVTRNENE